MNDRFYDRQHNPIDLFEWDRLYRDVTYRIIANDYIGERRVLTIWHGFYPYHVESELIFVSVIVEQNREGDEEWYDSEDEARRRHAERVEELRAR